MTEPSTEQEQATLGTVVDGTSGAQPWRRLFHALCGLGAAGLLEWLEPSRQLAVTVLGTIFLCLLASDVVRLASHKANRLFFVAFRRLASPREAAGLASSTWYVLGVWLCVILFPLHIAVSGVLVLALADPAASYCGRRWGKRVFLGGTVTGSLVFFGMACVPLLLRHPVIVALPTAVLVTLAERLPWPLDDNVAVPVACSASLTGIEFLL